MIDRRFNPAEAKAAVSIARIIGETVHLRRQGGLLVASCPFHTDPEPSFTVYQDHYHCFGCGEHGDVIDWLTAQRGMSFREALAYLGAPDSGRRAAPVQPVARASRASDNRAAAMRIWGEALDPRRSIVADYLSTRGLCLPPEPVLRFHPECPCRDRKLPAMVALLSDPVTGEPTGGIHRTFLRPDGSGKAEIEGGAKRMLGPWGVVRLYEPETAGIGLGEGIETALAVTQRIGWGPVWAACTAGGFAHVPPLVMRTLNLFIDNDDTGVSLREAETCKERWIAAGLEVVIHEPPEGTDWADAARETVP
jgi:hypothetical protein